MASQKAILKVLKNAKPGGGLKTLFLILLFCILFENAWPANTTQVVLLSHNGRSFQPGVRVPRGIMRKGEEFLDFNSHRELGAVSRQIAGIVQRLILASDPQPKIFIALVDDMNINASFEKRKDGSGVLRINLGLLRFLENDDELAFILGHELEHGVAQLGDEVIRMRLENQGNFARALSRTEENEVDIKSILRRVIDNGFNPHAAPRVLRRMRDTLGSGVGETHTHTGSRQGGVALAIQYLQRMEGRQLPPDDPELFSKTVVQEVRRQYFSDHDFTSRRLARWHEFSRQLPNPATALFQIIGQNGSLNDNQLELFEQECAGRFRMSQRFLGGLLTDQQARDIKLQINFQLDQQFEQARVKVLGEKFLGDTTNQITQLRKLTRRRYLPFTDEAELNEVGYVFSEEAKLTEEITRYRYDHALAPEERAVLLREAEQKLARTRGMLENLRQAYPNLEALRARHQAWRSSTQGKENTIRRDHLERHAQFGALMRRNRIMDETLLANSVQVIIQGLDHPRSWHDSLSLFWELPESLKKEHLFDLFERIEERAEFHLRKMQGTSEIHRLLHEVLSHSPESVFQAAWQADPERGIAALRRFYRMGLQYGAKSLGMMISQPRIATHDLRISDSISFSNTLAMQVFQDAGLANEVVEDFLRRANFLPNENGVRVDFAPLGHFYRSLDTLFSWGVLGVYAQRHDRAAIDIFRESMRQALIPNIEKVRLSLESAGVTPATTDMARAYFMALDQELYRFFPQADRPAFPALLEQVRQMAATLSTPHAAKRLAKMDLGLSIYNLSSMMEHQSEEQIFRYLYEVHNILDPEAGDLASSENVEFRTRFIDWLMAQPHSNDQNLDFVLHLARPNSYRKDVLGRSHRAFQLVFRQNLESLQQLPLRQRWHEAAMRVESRLSLLSSAWDLSKQELTDALIELFPAEPNARAQAWLGYIEGQKIIHSTNKTLDETFFFKWVPLLDLEKELRRPQFREQVSPEAYTDLVMQYMQFAESGKDTDGILTHWWGRTEGQPDLRRRFSPEMLRKVYYDENRQKMGLWQMEDRFHLQGLHEALKSSAIQFSEATTVRPIVLQVGHFIQSQLPDVGAVRDGFINHAERLLITNQAETGVLGKIRTNTDNWVKNRRLAAADFGYVISGAMDHEIDRLAVLEYVSGITGDFPAFVLRHSNTQELKLALVDARRSFMDSDLNSRTYAILPLIDPKEGVLSNAHTTRGLINHLLGEYGGQPVVRSLFENYLESLPESERTVVLSRLCSTFSSGAVTESGSRRLSLATVLETMGPLGIKAGQFLRSSGLLNPVMREELNHMFSRANPPLRSQIFERVQQLLGPQFSNIKYLGELVGSGSVNYVVRASVQEPHTGQARDVVVRILRSTVEGQVANEDRIWQRAIEKLRQSGDAEELRLSHLVDEARLNAMRSLTSGGQELNLALENEYYPYLRKSYEDVGSSPLGFRVEVARPLVEFSNFLPEHQRTAINLYDYVPSTNLEDIADGSLRSDLAEHIVRAELSAMLTHGAFDPDGHKGNWLIDLPGKRLVRIDYSQTMRLSETERNALRDVVGILITPSPAASERRRLQSHFETLFVMDGNLNPSELNRHLQEIFQDPKFPAYRSPHERLFFIRDQLETRLAGPGHGQAPRIRLTEQAQSVFASLARISGMREYMTPRQFGAVLARGLGLTQWAYGARVLSREILNEVSNVSLRRKEYEKLQGVPASFKTTIGIAGECIVNALNHLRK